jgi:hypothetical protein
MQYYINRTTILLRHKHQGRPDDLRGSGQSKTVGPKMPKTSPSSVVKSYVYLDMQQVKVIITITTASTENENS